MFGLIQADYNLSMEASRGITVKILTAVAVLTFSVSSAVALENREVKTIFWPDCQDSPSNCAIAKDLGYNVAYSKASTSNQDNLHFVFSTIGVPAIAIARTTGTDTDLYFDWDKLMSGPQEESIYFKDTKGLTVEYKYAVAFTRLIQYNDTDDNADLNDKNLKPEDWISSDFLYFFWDSLPDDNDGTNSVVFNTTHEVPAPPTENNNGSLSFSFSLFEDGGRASELPSLVYNANETLFDFILANYTPSFSKSRFALEAVLVSMSNNKEMSIETTRSIDDEYSPGVFQVTDWYANPDKKNEAGFMQWKPVCYLSTDRERSSATKVKSYDLLSVSAGSQLDIHVNSSIIKAFFGNVSDSKDFIVQASNVSFGLSGDGFYLKNNYTAWSAGIGYGSPPVDKISSTVMIIISAGLGIPVLLILFGGIFTCVRRLRGQSDYQAINTGSLNRNNPQ